MSIRSDREIAATALALAILSVGMTRLTAAPGLLAAEEPPAPLSRLAALGAGIDHHREPDGGWTCDIVGRGLGGLDEPPAPLLLDGPAAAMIAAILATHPIEAVVTGSFPEALFAVLRRMGAGITGRRAAAFGNGFAAGPFWVRGAVRPAPPDEPLEVDPTLVPALLLAALNVPGRTTLISPDAGRWLPLFGAFGAEIGLDGADRVTVTGERELVPATLRLISQA